MVHLDAVAHSDGDAWQLALHVFPIQDALVLQSLTETAWLRTWMDESARVMVMGTGSTLCTTSGGWKRRMYSGRCAAGPSLRLVCKHSLLSGTTSLVDQAAAQCMSAASNMAKCHNTLHMATQASADLQQTLQSL